MGLHTFQTNFTGGEQTPYLFARTDYQKYGNGAERLWNAVVKVTGGVARRAGTQFVAKAKSRSAFQPSAFQKSAFQVAPRANVRLVPFVFNTQEAYVLEFGSGYIRFYRNRQPLIGNPVFGAVELVTNGSFNFDLSGWTLQQDNGGAVTWDAAGVALLTPGASGLAGMSQAVNGLLTNNFYVVTFTVEGGDLQFGVGTAFGTYDLVGLLSVGPGQYRASFKAQGGTAVLQFLNVVAGTEVRLDSVSMVEADVLELSTPYKASQLAALRTAQIADTLYICHQDHPPKKLQRASDLVWTLQDVAFAPPATEEVELRPAATLTPGATVGIGVTFIAGASVFLTADVNRQIKSQGGVAVITAVVSGTQVTVDIIQPFPSTQPIGSGAWTLDGSPSAELTLSAKEPINKIINLTLDAPGFRTSDVGGFIHGLDGIIEITSVTTSSAAKGKILKSPTGTTIVAGNWTLEREAWSEESGYPGVVSADGQRLYFASTKRRPQTLWGSAAGDLENFGRGIEDDDAFVYTLSSNEVDVIRWLKPISKLIIGTIGSEYSAEGGDLGPITPTRIMVSPQSTWGSDPEPDALRAGPAAIFVQRGRQQVRELALQADVGYQAADLTILAEHIFRAGVTQLARVSSPDSFLLAVLSDGRMAVATYERAENVVAWSQFRPAGWAEGKAAYRAVCAIPSMCGSGDEVWVAVERTVGGTSGIYIEVFDSQLNTDAALVYDDPTAGVELLTGLNHLNGETVDVLRTPPRFAQKGLFQQNMVQRARTKHYQTTVVDGTIELPDLAVRVEVGLPYETEIKTLRPEVPAQFGTTQMLSKRSNTIYVRLYCSHGDGVQVAGQLIPRLELEAADVFDFRKEANLGWDREGQVTIKQTKPFPLTVLGVAYSWQVSDGDKP